MPTSPVPAFCGQAGTCEGCASPVLTPKSMDAANTSANSGAAKRLPNAGDGGQPAADRVRGIQRNGGGCSQVPPVPAGPGSFTVRGVDQPRQTQQLPSGPVMQSPPS